MRVSLCNEVISCLDFARQCEFAHIHLNDPNRRGPGEGALAFGPILAALKAQGYGGMAAIEPFIYEPDGPSCAARAPSAICAGCSRCAMGPPLRRQRG